MLNCPYYAQKYASIMYPSLLTTGAGPGPWHHLPAEQGGHRRCKAWVKAETKIRFENEGDQAIGKDTSGHCLCGVEKVTPTFHL